jgi:hypothetical protein
LAAIVIPTLAGFVCVVSLVGAALGLALIFRSSAALPFMAVMNRWVSTRQALESLEAPRRVAAAPKRWLGVVLVVVGGYAALTLIATFDVPRLALLLKLDPRYSLASLALDALKWALVVGAVAAVLAGLMLVFFPEAWRAFELRANRWYSTGALEAAGDRPHMSLDRFVEARPRASGAVLLALSLAAAVASAGLLFHG